MSPLRLITGLFLASLLAQFPAFSDRYVDVLTGHQLELSQTVQEASQPIRTANATPDMTIEDARRERLRMAQTRLEHTRDDISVLKGATPIQRILLLDRFDNPRLLRQTWMEFTPTLPVSSSGVILAAAGFLGGWLLALLAGLPFRRKIRT